MSGTWCDICTEQTLMKAAKSEGGLSRGRKRNSFFLATNAGCSPSIIYLMLTSRWRKTSVNMLHFTQTCSRHWCSEMQMHLNLPILGQTSPQTILGFKRTSQYNQHKELLVSFSTGFTSTRDDSVNAERAAEVGIEMEINLDGQSVTSTIWMSSQR